MLSMGRSPLMAALGALAMVASLYAASPASAADDTAPRKVAIHVDESDAGRMNLALNNAQNVNKYYADKGIPVQIRVVAYGPGLTMLRSDKSPVKDRISTMSLEMENLTFAACANTRAKMSKKEGAEIPIVSEAEIVPSGVIELVELQRQGWTYIRP